jgi:hypothetical protein
LSIPLIVTELSPTVKIPVILAFPSILASPSTIISVSPIPIVTLE